MTSKFHFPQKLLPLEYRSVQLVGYTDDINLMGRPLRAVKEVFEDLNRVGKQVGLKIN
jgi:hypothetical protein